MVCRGEEKRRRKRRKIFGEGKYLEKENCLLAEKKEEEKEKEEEEKENTEDSLKSIARNIMLII